MAKAAREKNSLRARFTMPVCGRTVPSFPVDCVSLPDTLLESELFGHEKGAFTGAHVSKPGLFEGGGRRDRVSGRGQRDGPDLCSRGCCGCCRSADAAVGGIRFLDVDVRVIAASNQDLNCLPAGRISEDLLPAECHSVVLPPLRNREGDILLLAREFLRRFMTQQLGVGLCAGVDASATDLCGYSWPGNVRELQNVIERACSSKPMGRSIRASTLLIGCGNAEGSLCVRRSRLLQTCQAGSSHDIRAKFLIDLLKRNDGHMGKAAREAQVDRKTVERMVKKMACANCSSESVKRKKFNVKGEM